MTLLRPGNGAEYIRGRDGDCQLRCAPPSFTLRYSTEIAACLAVEVACLRGLLSSPFVREGLDALRFLAGQDASTQA